MPEKITEILISPVLPSVLNIVVLAVFILIVVTKSIPAFRVILLSYSSKPNFTNAVVVFFVLALSVLFVFVLPDWILQ